MSKYKINGRIVSGTELVAIANKEFTKGRHGRGRYGRPKTADAAHHFLVSDLDLSVEAMSYTVYSRLPGHTNWMFMKSFREKRKAELYAKERRLYGESVQIREG